MWRCLSKVIVCSCVALLFAGACGGDGDPTAVGERCDTSGHSQCEGDSECMDDGSGDERCLHTGGGTCDPEADHSHCSPDLTCAPTEEGSNACHRPVHIRGMVIDSEDESPIEGAHVLGLDERKVAVTDVAISDEDGDYELEIPVERDGDGEPVDSAFTLRADAADYQAFPSGIRTALPVNTSTAEELEDGSGWTIEGSPTEIALIPLEEDERGQTTISGQVLADDAAGVLVVAEPDGFELDPEDDEVALGAVSDLEGRYTIFDVPDGDYEVRGYAGGLQLEPEDVTVDGAPLEEVDLSESDQGLVDLSGSVEIVDAPGDAATSIVLVVASTFDHTFVRGEVPAGLRDPETGDPDVTSQWEIEDVPAGEYVILAAFENDGLVRDPDENIAGTDFVTVEVAPGDDDVTVDDSFKITGALSVEGPGAERPEELSDAPTLQWEDDSSEDYYEVEVYNAYGDLVWENRDIDGVSGSNTVSVDYEGPTESGMYYQFRAVSWQENPAKGDSAISMTEDLRGVFYFE